MVLDELAVIARPGAPSRRPEVEPVAEVLATYRPCVRIEKPGTLDGGDVVVAGRIIYVGASRRTNAAGIDQLRALTAPYGYEVRAVDVHGCLHLKSACTCLGDGTLLVNQEWINPSQLDGHDLVNVAPHEPRAANTFRVGDKIVMAAGYPETLAGLQSEGYDVRTVSNAELEKAEGGVSCKSIIVTVGR